MAKFDKHEEELMNLMFGLSESIAEASESELLEEAKRNKVNLLDEAEEVRGILRSAGRAYLQRKLLASREAYEEAVAGMQKRACDLPETAIQRRQLLASILEEHPDFKPIVVTVQHRNFNGLTDEDIVSFLRQLGALGLLNRPPTRTSK